jgi:hypothetical protein
LKNAKVSEMETKKARPEGRAGSVDGWLVRPSRAEASPVRADMEMMLRVVAGKATHIAEM